MESIIQTVYLGAYDEEEAIAKAYDLVALNHWSTSTFTNFPVSPSAKELQGTTTMAHTSTLALTRVCPLLIFADPCASRLGRFCSVLCYFLANHDRSRRSPSLLNNPSRRQPRLHLRRTFCRSDLTTSIAL
ncbi:hypothetical protein QYF36_012590 [Acer negundo]|nr:hypothetical protein QYF36_012590 [Acer negundo]